jgi:hypothetical protein
LSFGSKNVHPKGVRCTLKVETSFVSIYEVLVPITMSTILELNCWVFGTSSEHISLVKIPKTDTVDDLREQIKVKQALHDIDVSIWIFIW